MCVCVCVCVCVTSSLSICQWPLMLFRVLPIVNSAAMDVGMHASFQIRVFSGYKPKSGIAESYGNCFHFCKEPHRELYSISYNNL